MSATVPWAIFTLYSSVILVGLVVGSFLNVCVYRLPRKKSLLHPASHCPACDAPIRWYDNIPLVSFLLLMGRCRGCGSRVAWRHPAVEALTGLLFLLTVWRFGIGVRSVLLLVFLCALVVVTFTDLEHQIIPHAVTLPGIPMGLIGSLITLDPSPWDAAAGALTGAGLVYFIAIYGEVVFRRESMGGGDVNLLALIGAFLGWRLMLVSFVLAIGASACLSLGLIAASVLTRKDQIPFGPFLALGAVITLFAGDRVIDWFPTLFQ